MLHGSLITYLKSLLVELPDHVHEMMNLLEPAKHHARRVEMNRDSWCVVLMGCVMRGSLFSKIRREDKRSIGSVVLSSKRRLIGPVPQSAGSVVCR